MALPTLQQLLARHEVDVLAAAARCLQFITESCGREAAQVVAEAGLTRSSCAAVQRAGSAAMTAC